MRPTRAHYLRIKAQQAHEGVDYPLENFSDYERMLHLLARHKKQLKQIQSKEKKAEFKAQILPEYLPWIEGALLSNQGKQDNVLMCWLVWSIDCKAYDLALKIASYALLYDLALPENYGRTLATVIAEEFADQAKTAHTIGQPFDVGYLLSVEELTKNHDMPDESRSRLLKELGLLFLVINEQTALNYLEKAIELNIQIGVKGEIKRLRKKLNIHPQA